MRPILKERYNPPPKEMMSLLGAEWRKLSKEEQHEWNAKASAVAKKDDTQNLVDNQQIEDDHIKFNCPFCEITYETKNALKEHISNTHLASEARKDKTNRNMLNKFPVPDNQERIVKCEAN